MTSKFRPGSSTFTCVCCKRLTRHTGVQGLGSQTCPQCYELAGLENCVQDNCFTDNDALIAQGEIQELVKKGVDIEKLKKLFDLLPAACFE